MRRRTESVGVSVGRWCWRWRVRHREEDYDTVEEDCLADGDKQGRAHRGRGADGAAVAEV